ncbi:MAG: four helix bundle protein [Candidatus Marithrix sp.]
MRLKFVNLCSYLHKLVNHIGEQISRSGTSPETNYAEVRNTESGNDFVHKLKIALKELNETIVWLKIIHKSELQPESKKKI